MVFCCVLLCFVVFCCVLCFVLLWCLLFCFVILLVLFCVGRVVFSLEEGICLVSFFVFFWINLKIKSFWFYSILEFFDLILRKGNEKHLLLLRREKRRGKQKRERRGRRRLEREFFDLAS